MAQNVFDKFKVGLLADLGTLPETMTERLSKVESSLAIAKETDSEKIQKAADDSGDVLSSIDGEAKRLIRQKQAYLADLGLVEQRVQALESHDKATVDFVKDKTDAVKTQLENAKKLAEKHQFVEAKSALLPVAEACAAAEELADQHAHFAAVLSDRESRVGDLKDSPHPEAQKLVTAVRDKLAKAKDQAAKPRYEFTQAVKLLGEIPQNCIDAAWLVKAAADYTTKPGAPSKNGGGSQ